VRQTLVLDLKDDTGFSQRDRILAAQEQAEKNGRSVKPMPEPEIPEGYERLWGHFWELSRARGSGGFDLMPLSYGDIADYNRLMEAGLGPFDVTAIRRMDEAFLGYLKEQRGNN